ncbi:rop guanine nucleotide exchange factor 14-like [Capsicum annuum]
MIMWFLRNNRRVKELLQSLQERKLIERSKYYCVPFQLAMFGLFGGREIGDVLTRTQNLLTELDTMPETLDSMSNTKFWYTEVSSRAEEKNTKWSLPSPKIPVAGLSDIKRKKLLNQQKLVNQIFKAAKPINENVLSEMAVPTVIKDALPKSGRTSLGEDLYRILTAKSTSAEEMFSSLNLTSETNTLEVVNRLGR